MQKVAIHQQVPEFDIVIAKQRKLVRIIIIFQNKSAERLTGLGHFMLNIGYQAAYT